MSDNKVVLKMLDQFNKVEDLKEFANAQYNTIIGQTKKINELETKVAELEVKNKRIENEANLNKPSDGKFETNDTETTCLIQLAIIKNNALGRELTLEETKKLEIFAKTLLLVRGKTPSMEERNKQSTKKLSNSELLSMMDEAMKLGE